MLTQKKLKNLLSYDKGTGFFVWKKFMGGIAYRGKIAGGYDKRGYIQIKINKKMYPSHRLAWLYEYGEFPKQNIDHINRNKEDNRICNLKEVSHMENMNNCSGYNKSNYGKLGTFRQNERSKFRKNIEQREDWKLKLGIS